MAFSSTQEGRDYYDENPDAHAIATQWVSQAQRVKGAAPAAADLAEMITGVGLDFTMQGAPQIEIDIHDPDWVLMDTGFFDPTQDKGTLDDIEIEFGARASDNQPYHWTLFQVSPRGSDYTVQTYWVPRVVVALMRLHGPFGVNRASRTRAEFLKMCASKVPYARFHSKQLTTVQQIAPLQVPITGGLTAAPTKKVGVSAKTMKDSSLTVKGSPLGPRQRDNLNVLLNVADKLGAGKVATEALVYAAVWESNLEIYQDNGTYWGVLSGKKSVWSQTDTSGMAKAFLLGDSAKGFQGGGAIALSATISNPIEIAVKVEVPSIWPDNAYAKEGGYPGDAAALQEVDALIEAGGGATGVGGVSGAPVEPVQQYNFTIGTSNDPHEDYWTGMNRNAQEVNWELVVDGDDIYYDSDITMCRDEIAAVIDRNDAAVADWTYDWDRTQLPTNFQLELECEPFEFSAAQVFKLTRFGPASAGSTIGLPGRWLIGEIQRNPGDIISTFTLVQPTKPLPEPAPQLGVSSVTKGGAITLTGKGVNPFANATNLVAERVDMGKDYSMAPGSEILAPFDSKFLGWYPNWFQGQPYMAFQIVGGTYNGWAYYLAEQINMKSFKVGQIIKAGTVIATYANSGTGIEMGLANPKNWQQTLSQANGSYSSDGVATPEGKRWEAILKALGAPV